MFKKVEITAGEIAISLKHSRVSMTLPKPKITVSLIRKYRTKF